MKLAVVGAGWAGLAAAVEATLAGHHVVVLEAARVLGGRARAMPNVAPGRHLADGTAASLPPSSAPAPRPITLDNGQHIVIGAYTETLRLMATVGVDAQRSLLRMPLALRFPDGTGLACPDWPAPFDALAGILGARGWTWRDKLALLACTAGWQRRAFRCAPAATVADLCRTVTPRVIAELIEPLCASALNTAASEASGQVFLRVLQDSLLGPRGGSHLLIPRTDLGALFPVPAAAWLAGQGGEVRTGRRVRALARRGDGWQIDSDGRNDALPGSQAAETFDAVLLACPSWEAARLVRAAGLPGATTWLARADGLHFEAIATVYATSATGLSQPMLALRSGPAAPAQFVFDRRHLATPAEPVAPAVPTDPTEPTDPATPPDPAELAARIAMGPAGPAVLAFVVSVSQGDRALIERQVLAQGRAQLGLADLAPLQTVVEKRATFACVPGLRRPAMTIAPGLLACGEYVDGPYPGTLEGAVRSGVAAARALASSGFIASTSPSSP